MAANNPVIAIKTDDTTDVASNMIMINARPDSATPRTEAYFTNACVKLIVLLLSESIDSFDPSPSGFFFLNVCHQN